MKKVDCAKKMRDEKENLSNDRNGKQMKARAKFERKAEEN